MKVELKTWAGLGLATALAGAGVSGCSGEAGGEGGETAQTVQSGEAGEGGEGGETGESGESGEGGVAVEQAATDPIIYGSALAIAEAHAIAAKDALVLGKTDAAAEMFAHPVSEVLAEMDPIFEKQGVADFKPLFADTSAAILAGESADQIEARFETIIAALRSAAEKAPDDGSSRAFVAGGVVADMIDRAVSMYSEAKSSERYEPYLDGYGFYKAGAEAFGATSPAIEAENSDLHAALSEALELLAAAYPSAERPAGLNVDQGELLAAGSKVMLAQ